MVMNVFSELIQQQDKSNGIKISVQCSEFSSHAEFIETGNRIQKPKTEKLNREIRIQKPKQQMKNKITIAFLLLLTSSVAVAQDKESSKMTNSKTETSANLFSEKSIENKTINERETDAEAKQKFLDKAKKAGIPDEKINQILDLISKRGEELRALTAENKKANSTYSILEPGEQYSAKMRIVRNRYTKLINTSMTYPQYGSMMVDDFRDQANENSKIEFIQLIRANPSLTKDQQIKLYETIYNFHLNELLTTSYLSFDQTLQKPKLGSLRFDFEKTFGNICKEYNVKTTSDKDSNNSFQWNN